MYKFCGFDRLKNLFSCYKNKSKINVNKKIPLISLQKVIQKSIINKNWKKFLRLVFKEKSMEDSIEIYEYIIQLVKIPNYAKKITELGLKEFKNSAKKNSNGYFEDNLFIDFLFIKSYLSIFFYDKNLNDLLEKKQFLLEDENLQKTLTNLNEFMKKFLEIKEITENEKFIKSQLKFLESLINKSFELYLRIVIKIDLLFKKEINFFFNFSNNLLNFFIKIKNYFDKQNLNKRIILIKDFQINLEILKSEKIPKLKIYKKIEEKIEKHTPKDFNYIIKEEIKSFYLRIENLKLKSLTKGIYFSTNKSSSTYEIEFEDLEKDEEETHSVREKSHFYKNSNYEKNFLKLSNFFTYKKKIEKKFYSHKKKCNKSFSLLNSTKDQQSHTFSKTYNSLLKSEDDF